MGAIRLQAELSAQGRRSKTTGKRASKTQASFVHSKRARTRPLFSFSDKVCAQVTLQPDL